MSYKEKKDKYLKEMEENYNKEHEKLKKEWIKDWGEESYNIMQETVD